MGIQYLNTYIKNNVGRDAIIQTKLSDLSGKVIAVDTSIYLYRFLAEEALLEHMYTMISLFRYYNIIPIFVFDGKAPAEKNKLLQKRNTEKNIAEEKYYHIKQELEVTKNTSHYNKLNKNMITLKKKFVRIKKQDIIKVQNLMDAFGVTYIKADGEADEVCAKLVIKKYAYACLSEDMDLFVYGCPRVLRYLSLLNETVVVYYLDIILKDLDITLIEFKEICVLSGTDYNYNTNNTNNITSLQKTLDYFKLFKEVGKNTDFYTWLDDTSNYITNIYQLYNIYNMFKVDNISLKNIKVNNLIKDVNLNKIKEIMKPEGFIFIE